MLDDGTSVKINMNRAALSSDRVLCIVDPSTKSIFIWQGRAAGVRRRFVGAQTASSLRKEQGLDFKVQAVQEGEEPDSLLNVLP
jgi:hypothetical protein